MEGQTPEQIAEKGTLNELKEVRAQMRAQVSPKKEAKDEPLPVGTEPVGSPTEKEAAPEEHTQVEKEAPKAEEAEGPIRIGDREFKTEKEAFAYAEKLEQEKLVLEGYNQGVREALQSTQKPTEVKPEEDKFDEEFYSNPRQALTKVKEQAKSELRAELDAQNKEEKAWNKFSALNPDLADSRPEVMRILQENWEVLGKMNDEDRAMKILATKTRAYFDSIVEKRKPRTELPQKAAQVVSPAGTERPSVTQAKKETTPLTMSEQLKNLRKR